VANGATLNINNVALGNEAVTLNGTGVGAAGALTGTGAASLAGNVTLNTASTVGVTAAADTLTLSGAVSGGVALTKVGAGTLTLSGANTYTGATNVNAGTLVASNAAALGTTAAGTTVAAGATLNINNVAIGAEATTLNGTLQGAGTASLAGTVALGATNAVNTAAVGDTLTLSGVVSGANALNKNGAGTVVLSGAANNTYTGVTNINAGTLVASKAGALGTTAGGTTVANGATLQINNVAIGAEAVTLNGIGVGGNGALQGTGTASLTGNVTLATASTVGAPALADTLTLSGVVSGANNLTKVGAGTVVLSGVAANTYGGATNVNAGTLRVGSAANKIPNASAVTVAAGATLDLNNISETVGSIAGAGNITLGSATLTAGGNNSSTIYSGVISGAGGMTKAGTGALTLSGASTYAGPTAINAGTVVAANANALGTTASGTTVANGATLNINNVALGNEAVTLNGTGVGAAGALTGTGAASLGGPVTVATASRVGAAASNSLALNGAVQGPGALDVAGGGTITFGNAVGSLTPLGSITTAAGTTLNVDGGLLRTAGTQIYNGPVTAGGPTTLQTTNSSVVANGAVTATAGTLTLNTGTGNVTMTSAANDFVTVTIPSGGAVTLVDQSALALGASSVSTLTGTAAGVLNVNGTLTASGAGNSIVLSGASFVNNAGAGSLVVPGAGRWIVYSTDPAGNTFSGLSSGNQAIWNATLAGNPPATIPAGNRYVFSTQPTLTFTSTDAAKIYGDVANVSGNYTVGGYVNAATYGNVFTQDTAANAFTGTPSVTSAGIPAIANVGAYPITVAVGSLTSSTGYALGFNSAGQLTVSARPITVIPGPLTRPYGDPNPATTATLTVGGSGLVNGNTITQVDVTSPATATDPAGSAHALNASNAVFGGGGVAANYAITYAPGVLTITQRPITVQASDQARAYGDPNPGTGPFTITVGSLAGTDAIGSVNVTSPALPTAPAGSVWVLTNAGANFASGNASNYAITLQNGQLTIAQRPITVKANDQNRTYGDPNPATGPFTIAAGSLVGTDSIGSVNVTSPALPNSPARSVWVLTNTGTNFTSGSAANYAITLQNGQLTIDPRAITVQANNQARTYGDPNPATGPYTITAGSLAGGESITNVSVTSPSTVLSGVGPYALTPTSANFGIGSATNYTVTFVDGVLTVTPRPITVTANNQAKVYGQADPALTFTAPTVNGDLLAGALARAPGETVAGGPYAIMQGTVTNANNANYSITFMNGQLLITPAALAIAADNKTRLYGDPNPPLTATFTGLTNGDTPAAIPGVTLTTPATFASNVGNYAINVASGGDSNYTIAYVNGQLTITPAPLTITANDASRRFGEPNPPFAATMTGFKLGQTAANLNGTVVLDTPATVLSPTGTYPIVPSGVSSSNYAITFVDGRLLISQGIPPADPALITAVARSESTGEPWIAPPPARGIDCLVLERPGIRRVLNRCY
jgi:autotransporter-associated beta strand protein